MNRLALAILLITFTPLSFAQLTYAPINVPGAAQTESRGINNNGEIVGFYKTTTCGDYDIKVPACPTKGFKYVNGTYTKLMVPNSLSTAILGGMTWAILLVSTRKPMARSTGSSGITLTW